MSRYDECTEAIVTRGWVRKEQANVRRCPDSYRWLFVASKRRVEQTFQKWLDEQREYALTTEREWVPVRALPPARVVERKS